MSAGHRQNRPALVPGEMHLWTLLTDAATNAATACHVEKILSASEIHEARRFRPDASRQQFVIARAMLKLALSCYFPVPAGAWCFDRDEFHRPFITAPEIGSPVWFSVSHTPGLIACLISASAEAAVDVEKVEHNHDLELVASEVLSPAEQIALSALSGRDWTTRFFDHWTLKEAYAKARGVGLNMAFSDIGFDLDEDDTIRMRSSSKTSDESSNWLFWNRHWSTQHIISVAAKKVSGKAPEIILRPVKFDGAEISLEE